MGVVKVRQTPVVKRTPLTHIHIPIIHSLLCQPLTYSTAPQYIHCCTHVFILRTQFNYTFTVLVPMRSLPHTHTHIHLTIPIQLLILYTSTNTRTATPPPHPPPPKTHTHIHSTSLTKLFSQYTSISTFTTSHQYSFCVLNQSIYSFFILAFLLLRRPVYMFSTVT